MASPAAATKGISDPPLRDNNIIVQLNNLTTTVRLIASKLDSGNVAGATFAASCTDSAVATAPVIITL